MTGCKIASDLVLCPTAFGVSRRMSKIDAGKQLAWAMDTQDYYWHVIRLEDDYETVEHKEFATLRAAMTWLLRWHDVLRNAGATMTDAILLAHELKLLYGTGIPVETAAVMPQVWEVFKPHHIRC